MELGRTYRLGEDFKVIIWGGQATKGWDHFLLGELTPQDTMQRFSFGNWRRARLDEMVKMEQIKILNFMQFFLHYIPWWHLLASCTSQGELKLGSQ